MILARNNRDHGRTGYAEGCDHHDERSPFHGRSLVSFQNISDCNCQLCISDVIVVTSHNLAPALRQPAKPSRSVSSPDSTSPPHTAAQPAKTRPQFIQCERPCSAQSETMTWA